MVRLLLKALLPLALAGCHLPMAKAGLFRVMAPGHGDVRQERIERLGRPLCAVAPLDRDVRFRVSPRGGLGAWAWGHGRIEVSRELVDLLDDAELSAALAHEIAHLIPSALQGRHNAALAGSARNESVEQAADRLGCLLLASVGAPPEAMMSMLRKVSTGLRDPNAFARRIEAASGACSTSPGPYPASS